mgnify:CR=1 FL=1
MKMSVGATYVIDVSPISNLLSQGGGIGFIGKFYTLPSLHGHTPLPCVGPGYTVAFPMGAVCGVAKFTQRKSHDPTT